MSFQITEPGFYRQRNGGKAEVFAERNGWWYGYEEAGVARRWRGTGASSACDRDYDIVSAWHEPPEPIDPGEGWRILKDGEPPQKGDECRLRDGTDEWFPSENWVHRPSVQAPFQAYRRRIPKPFSISEHGPGIYETRDGREAAVNYRSNAADYEWWGHLTGGYKLPKSWRDNGRWQSDGERKEDLVRYIGPLPVEQPWVPTNDYRVTSVKQKWVRGTESEWRPVEVEQ